MIDLAKKKINFTKLMTELDKADAERLAAMTPEERRAELKRRKEDRRTCRSKSKIIKSLTHKQVKETDIMELFDKPLALDPSKFDQAAFADDIKTLLDAGYFDDIDTEEELQQRLATIAAKNYGNGELLLLSDTLQMVRSKLGEMMKKLENRITKDEAEEKGRRQGVESAANLRGILGEIMGMKTQGDRIEKKVGETRRDQLTRAHYDRVNGIPKDKRESGGGRKKDRDIGDKQVKAALKYADAHPALSFRAACAHIVRTMKEGDFENPFTTAETLDTAVRRYCDKIGRRVPSKPRSGKWSAKS